MKMQNINNVVFGKILKAYCTPDNNKPSEIYGIYELEKDNPEDKDFFEKLAETDKWRFGSFANRIDKIFNEDSGISRSYYEMEDKDGGCVGFSVLEHIDNTENNVEYIQTKSSAELMDKNRKYANFGRTLMLFLAKVTQKEDKALVVDIPLISNLGFFDKFGFSISPEYDPSQKEPKSNFMIDNWYEVYIYKYRLPKVIENNSKIVNVDILA